MALGRWRCPSNEGSTAGLVLMLGGGFLEPTDSTYSFGCLIFSPAASGFSTFNLTLSFKTCVASGRKQTNTHTPSREEAFKSIRLSSLHISSWQSLRINVELCRTAAAANIPVNDQIDGLLPSSGLNLEV